MILISLFCFLNRLNVFGQYDLPGMEKKVMEEIKSDSAIFFTCFHKDSYFKERVKGLGEVLMFSKGYVFYCKNGSFYSRQFMEILIDDGSDLKYFVSQPIKLEDQELFDFAKNSFKVITKERIRPFVYQYHDSKSNTSIYQEFQISHPDGKSILILFGNQHVYADINEHHLKFKENLQNRQNLNFEYNNQTKQKALYQKVVKLIDKLDNQYEY